MDHFYLIVGIVILFLLYNIHILKIKNNTEPFSASNELITSSRANQLRSLSNELGSGVWNKNLTINGDLEVFGVSAIDPPMINTQPTDPELANNLRNTYQFGSRIIYDTYPVVIGGSNQNGKLYWFSKDGTAIFAS
jgi:hypothetical protein